MTENHFNGGVGGNLKQLYCPYIIFGFPKKHLRTLCGSEASGPITLSESRVPAEMPRSNWANLHWPQTRYEDLDLTYRVLRQLSGPLGVILTLLLPLPNSFPYFFFPPVQLMRWFYRTRNTSKWLASCTKSLTSQMQISLSASKQPSRCSFRLQETILARKRSDFITCCSVLLLRLIWFPGLLAIIVVLPRSS